MRFVKFNLTSKYSVTCETGSIVIFRSSLLNTAFNLGFIDLSAVRPLWLILITVAAPIKDAASIQKLFFELMHYDAFYPKSFTRL